MSSNAGCPTHMPTCSFFVAFDIRSGLMSLTATGGPAVLSRIYGSAYPLVLSNEPNADQHRQWQGHRP